MGEYHMNPDSILGQIPHLRSMQKFLAARDIEAAGQAGFSSGADFPETIDRLSEERVSIYCAAIEQQLELQEAGIQRVQTLREFFPFYVHHVLGGQQGPAAVDLIQQETDIAIMVSFSHSFKQHAERLSDPVRPDIGKWLGKIVDEQFKLRQAFNATAMEDDTKAKQSAAIAPQSAALEIIRLKDEFEYVTLNVANANMQLSQTNLRLFQNIGSGLYAWIKSLKEASGDSAFCEAFYPQDDWRYEGALLELSLDRIEAYAKRAKSLYELADRVAESCREDERPAQALSL
ncbi:MAG TPA: hypothetical protein DCM27_05715 [Rhodospirillaceae bacterium]|nr:hypothetical protein [Rhodospirillaceae bacterium]